MEAYKILLDFIDTKISKSNINDLLRHTYYIYIGDITYNEAIKIASEVNDFIKSPYSKASYVLYKPHVTVSCPQQDVNTYMCAVTLHE